LSQVRGVTAQNLWSDWAGYKPFIYPNLHSNYLITMACSAEYAGEPELIALSIMYGVAIHVWGADGAHREIRESTVGVDAPTVHLAHRDARSCMNHFFALQLLEHGQVRSQSIVLLMRGYLCAMRPIWQVKVESVAAHEDATHAKCSAVVSSFDDQAAPNAGACQIDPISPEYFGTAAPHSLLGSVAF
jgi:hypothetical protein